MESSQAKLTLRLSQEVIQKAKDIALNRGTSVSKMVEEYFELLNASNQDSDEQQESLAERTKFLKGILKNSNS